MLGDVMTRIARLLTLLSIVPTSHDVVYSSAMISRVTPVDPEYLPEIQSCNIVDDAANHVMSWSVRFVFTHTSATGVGQSLSPR
jgi:hypothetical protein